MKNEFPVDIDTGYGVMTVHNKAEADFAWHEIYRYYIEMADRIHRERREAVHNG